MLLLISYLTEYHVLNYRMKVARMTIRLKMMVSVPSKEMSSFGLEYMWM